MRDALLLVDIFDDFGHEHGRLLLSSFRSRVRHLRELVDVVREREVPIVYANDSHGTFDGDARRLVEIARSGPAGDCLDEITPRPDDRFVIKPRYSAFDLTPLALILRELDVERVLLAGMTTEQCVTQTAIAAREEGYKVTVVASACATIDAELEAIALAYLERIVGVRIATPAEVASDAGDGVAARLGDEREHDRIAASR